jgi:threonine/homoserine/homoserine lactone efflux protein
MLLHSATAFHVVKLAGAGYLVWLGTQSVVGALRGSHPPAEGAPDRAPDRVSPQRCFVEGFLSNVLNPKVALFYLAFLPQFIGPTDPVVQQFLLLAGIHSLEGILWLVVVSIVVEQTRQFFLHATVRHWIEGVWDAVGRSRSTSRARTAIVHQSQERAQYQGSSAGAPSHGLELTASSLRCAPAARRA